MLRGRSTLLSVSRVRRRQPGQAEIEDLDRAVGADLDVRGFEIAMDDAPLVRGFERVGDLFRDRQRFGQRYRTLRDPILKRLALDELENERMGLWSILEGVNRRDVWGGSAASSLASRLKRANRSGSLANRGAKTLMATARFNLVSWPPLAPAPSGPTISYPPRRTPGARGIS